MSTQHWPKNLFSSPQKNLLHLFPSLCSISIPRHFPRFDILSLNPHIRQSAPINNGSDNQKGTTIHPPTHYWSTWALSCVCAYLLTTEPNRSGLTNDRELVPNWVVIRFTDRHWVFVHNTVSDEEPLRLFPIPPTPTPPPSFSIEWKGCVSIHWLGV